MLSNFFVSLLCFAVGAYPLMVISDLTGTPFDLSWYFMHCIIMCCVSVRMQYAYALKGVEKEQLYQELQSYIDECVGKIPELHGFKVKLHVSGDFVFNASALMMNRITVTHAWYSAAAMSDESKEYLKSTLCHELYHISRGHRLPVNIMNIYVYFASFIPRRIPLRDKILLASWQEELGADHFGCIWYGDKARFLSKMEAMRRLGSVANERLSTHPSWDVRIRYIMEGIEPTPENVEKEYWANFEAFCVRKREMKRAKRRKR